ncbi:hypothetical protein [Lacticaseibacillus parakribbianus]|uniref:hypothetical protein n=1 Tax=Lacticaseibacillus parakribbianus TaxID=2970927 RepID=UPI0021CB481C|nr:hypothetical protein [Lacticaseibacillus parakribbianus]
MAYKTLRVVSYERRGDVTKEYRNRFEGESAVHTNLKLSPNERDHKSTTQYPIFFVITPGIYTMSAQILQ